jgi:signal transduction histidine kinase
MQNPILKNKPLISFNLIPSRAKKLYIETDEFRLKQILNNLISNAIKYTKQGFIEISANREGNSVLFKVKDTGVGILPENLDKVFDRFRKIDDNDTNPYRGGGLGLTISENLVKMMNGTIWVDSEMGKGSTFYFRIPGVYEK